ncbi:methyltransferase [Streptosporangium sp. CA-115845]|uniref:methyltransferase n=1 Tax=Streptosporangium sp. CA-115845 TaxID=3240071 RepID=UPI003D8A1741
MDNSWTSTPSDLSAQYLRHTGTLRGALRHALVARALHTHLPAGPQRVLDVGGGDGHQAIQLARAGHTVTLLDPDPAMLKRAQTNLAAEPGDVRQRVTVVLGSGEHAGELVGDGFDVACCHGVLMYVAAPHTLLSAMVAAVRPGGLISVLTKNGDALAMRPGLEARWADALQIMNAGTEVGNLGVTSRGHTLRQLQTLMTDAGAVIARWYGVRIFTDHLGDAPIGPDFDLIVQAEWQAGSLEPYRRVARLLHLIAHTPLQEGR